MNDTPPDLSGKFPHSVPGLKISADLHNRTHGPHYDILQAIPGGTEQIRVSPQGNVLGGTTNVGPSKIGW